MKRLIGILALVFSSGCTTTQVMTFDSNPSDAAIHVNGEYIGKSPTQYTIDDVDDHDSLTVTAEKPRYDSKKQLIGKKGDGLFPGSIFITLQPMPPTVMAPGDITIQGGNTSVQMQMHHGKNADGLDESSHQGGDAESQRIPTGGSSELIQPGSGPLGKKAVLEGPY